MFSHQQQAKNQQESVSQRKSVSQVSKSPYSPLLQMQRAVGNQATIRHLTQQLQRKIDPNTAQLMAGPQPLQKKSSDSNKMPEDVQAKMEGAFQTDFSGVNIHEGSKASEVGAHAYTQGNDIHFAQGKFQPHTPAGQELLGHELTHVVQQRQGRVKPTTQAKGMLINDDPKLEQEADSMGRKAAQTKMEEDDENRA